MTMNEYQEQAAKTDRYPNDRKRYCHLLGLLSEAGEVAGKTKKAIRDGWTDEMLIASTLGELGDVLWYVSALARDMGISLDEVAECNLLKLADRAARGAISGSGDNR